MKTDAVQPNGAEKKDDDAKKELGEGECKKAKSQNEEGEKKAEKQIKAECQAEKRDEKMKQSNAHSHVEKDHNDNKVQKPNESLQKTAQSTPFTIKVPGGDQRKCDKKEDQCCYSSVAYSPRTMSLKHYSKSYLTHNDPLDGMENNNSGPILKQKWESERQPMPESMLSASSHFPMTRLSSTVLPHYSNYIHQSVHSNTENVCDYPSSYPYRSFLQRHASQ